MAAERPPLKEMSESTLASGRILFDAILETIKNMELLCDKDRDIYAREIEDEIDAIDVELLSRGHY